MITIPNITELTDRIAKALADQLHISQADAHAMVDDCLTRGPDSPHFETVKAAAAPIIKPYWDAIVPVVRMVATSLAPLLGPPQGGPREVPAAEAADHLAEADAQAGGARS